MITPLSIPCPWRTCRKPANEPCRDRTTGKVRREHHKIRVETARTIASDRGLPFDNAPAPEDPHRFRGWRDQNTQRWDARHREMDWGPFDD